MREILFRGKRVDSGEWAEGDLSISYTRFPAILTRLSVISVIPETVGQFTGLTDKNGVKIFEGDKIIYWVGNEMESEEKESVVTWIKDAAMWSDLTLNHCISMQVIGNIHEN